VPASTTKIRSQINPRKNKIKPAPINMCEGDAIGRVPLTRKASNPPGKRRAPITQRREEVMAWPMEDCSTSGATMRTSPKREATLAREAMPGRKCHRRYN